MKTDNKGRVISFSEKPKGDDLKAMVIVKHYKYLRTKCIKFNAVKLTNTLGSGHHCFRIISRGSWKKALHCINGSLYLQEGNPSEPFKVTYSFQYDSYNIREIANVPDYSL